MKKLLDACLIEMVKKEKTDERQNRRNLKTIHLRNIYAYIIYIYISLKFSQVVLDHDIKLCWSAT